MSFATERLRETTLEELANVPFDRWGYFFPFMIAFWNFIQEQYPGVLGELRAHYAKEPVLTGEGSQWFSGVLMENEELLDIIEPMAYSILDRLPREIAQRGFVRKEEIPHLAEEDFNRLADIIAAEVARYLSGREGAPNHEQ